MTFVKGTIVKNFSKIIKKKYGKDGQKQWLESLSPGALNIYNFAIDEDEWYPLKEALIEPTANFCMLFYNWDFKGAWELGRQSADFEHKTLKKMGLKTGSPEILIKKAGEILQTYYRPSTMKVVEIGEFNAILQITDFTEINKIVEYRICGWMERALEMCGCSQITVKVTASSENLAPYTEITLSWSK